jgi:hypothetical protein
MLKRVQHYKKKCVIPNLFRNLDFDDDNGFIALVSVTPTQAVGPRVHSYRKQLTK